MVVPEEREGKMEEDPNLSRDTTPANATANTRKGGQKESQGQSKVRNFVRNLIDDSSHVHVFIIHGVHTYLLTFLFDFINTLYSY